MTPDEIGKLTISEVESIANRAAEALAKFRDAQRSLGMLAPSSSVRMDPRFANPNAPTESPLSAPEVAEKQRLMQQFKANQYTPPPDGL